MTYEVYVTRQAEQDLIEIYDYVAKNDSEKKARQLIEKLYDRCLSLEKHPNRGHFPPELERINIREYLEIHFKPYRIIYQIRNSNWLKRQLID